MAASSPSHRVSTGERINTAETTGRLQQILSERGIRMTKQRRVILQVMDAAEQHLDVDQILARAQKIDSGVHLVTVYRTIDLLKKQGLIDELDLLHLRGDRHYYESHGPRGVAQASQPSPDPEQHERGQRDRDDQNEHDPEDDRVVIGEGRLRVHAHEARDCAGW